MSNKAKENSGYLSTADPNAEINSCSIPTDPKDPRCEDFGQFRIEGNVSDARHLVEALVSNGYSVTLKEDRTGINGRVFVMYRFSDL